MDTTHMTMTTAHMAMDTADLTMDPTQDIMMQAEVAAATALDEVRACSRSAAQDMYHRGPGMKRPRVADSASDMSPAAKKARKVQSAYISRFNAKVYGTLLEQHYGMAQEQLATLQETKNSLRTEHDHLELAVAQAQERLLQTRLQQSAGAPFVGASSCQTTSDFVARSVSSVTETTMPVFLADSMDRGAVPASASTYEPDTPPSTIACIAGMEAFPSLDLGFLETQGEHLDDGTEGSEGTIVSDYQTDTASCLSQIPESPPKACLPSTVNEFGAFYLDPSSTSLFGDQDGFVNDLLFKDEPLSYGVGAVL